MRENLRRKSRARGFLRRSKVGFGVPEKVCSYTELRLSIILVSTELQLKDS